MRVVKAGFALISLRVIIFVTSKFVIQYIRKWEKGNGGRKY